MPANDDAMHQSLLSRSDVNTRIELFAFCAHAHERDSFLSLLDIFDVVRARDIPFLMPEIMVALRLRFWPMEVGRHTCAVHLIDPDGISVKAPISLEFSINPFDENRTCAYNLRLKVPDVIFRCFGEHSLDFYLDGQMAGRLPLIVEKAR